MLTKLAVNVTKVRFNIQKHCGFCPHVCICAFLLILTVQHPQQVYLMNAETSGFQMGKC